MDLEAAEGPLFVSGSVSPLKQRLLDLFFLNLDFVHGFLVKESLESYHISAAGHPSPPYLQDHLEIFSIEYTTCQREKES